MSNTINGRTPEEIKKGLESCNMHQCPLLECPYFNDNYCGETLNADALAYIQQLERERDAAVEGLTIIANDTGSCVMCKHRIHPGYVCDRFEREENCYEWRGI
jgi:hypothetical protein